MERSLTTSNAASDPSVSSPEHPSHSWDQARAAFRDAAAWFADTLYGVGERWEQPGLGEWDVRALAGHTSRALLTVETYLARPAQSVAVASAAAYFSATRAVAAGPDVAERGRDAGRALGPDPAGAVALIVARVLPLLDPCTGGEVIETIAGGMRLADYLPTRTFELVMHTVDLHAALGIEPATPEAASRTALTLVTDLAQLDGHATTVLRALTGRTELPHGFTIL
jgi:hypothetical protein